MRWIRMKTISITPTTPTIACRTLLKTNPIIPTPPHAEPPRTRAQGLGPGWPVTSPRLSPHDYLLTKYQLSGLMLHNGSWGSTPRRVLRISDIDVTVLGCQMTGI